MPKFIVIFESRTNVEVENILNSATPDNTMPEGVQKISTSAFLLEFPKNDLFLSKMIVSADDRKITHHIFQIAES